MKIEEGETIQKGVPTPDNPVEIINIFKDLDYAVKIVESIRNKVTRINVPEQNKEYDIPFLDSTESQAVTTVLYRLSEYSEEINKLNNVIDRIKNYAYQEVAHITEDIKDYIDDDKEGNKNIIGEFKETREQWKDIIRIIEGKTDTDLYINWKEWGEYE